jgi:hypothetical protein
MRERTFGWVQDPGRFDSLRTVVQLFDPDTAAHRRLVSEEIPRLVADAAVRDRLLQALGARPLHLSYTDLAGRALGGPRAHDPCNGIVQAALKGQRRDFLSDWAAENFVRWAHALCFLSHDRATDAFALTDAGRAYAREDATEDEAREVLGNALLSYPPTVRILRLLKETGHRTKYEIGRELGFVGESGFTSLNQDMVVRELYLEGDGAVRRRLMTELEGSSDKYARTVAGWLEKMDWVRREAKTVFAQGEGLFAMSIPQAYVITPAGLSALRRADGGGRHSRSARHVCFEMLATKAPSRDYLRARRATLLQILSRGYHRMPALLMAMSRAGFQVNHATVEADIEGLRNLGLRVATNARGGWTMKDKIQGLDIPRFQLTETRPNDLTRQKEEIRARLTHVPHEYLALLDLAYDGTQNRVFEFQTMALFELMGYKGRHLGGSDRPDGVFHTEGLARDYGLIVDAKAYRAGFACTATARDEMKRYVDENRDRPAIHPNAWWSAFPPQLRAPEDFRFVFVSGSFVGKFREQLQRLGHGAGGTRGAVIGVADLLLFAEAVLARRVSLAEGSDLFASLDAVTAPPSWFPDPDAVHDPPTSYQARLPLEWADA